VARPDAGVSDAGPDAGGDAGPPPAFVDVAEDVGLVHVQEDLSADAGMSSPCPTLTEDCLYYGETTGGAAVADFDDDGDPDVLLTSVSGRDALYRNVGGVFEDVTSELGITHEAPTNGAVFADVDGDDDLDLYVIGYGATRHFLYMQDDDGTFREEAVRRGVDMGLGRPLLGIGASFGDFDGDGWLDLHVTEWIHDAQIATGDEPRSATRLLRNRGAEMPGYFEDVTEAAGVDVDDVESEVYEGSFAFTSTFSDLDGDGWLDLLVAGDYGTSRVFWNDGDGTFTDGSAAMGLEETPDFGMGSAVGDHDGDGDLDWFFTSISREELARFEEYGNRLFVNEGERAFTENSYRSGTRLGGWGWGVAFVDFDNDGDLDLAQANGSATDEPTRLFVNRGGGRFDERAMEHGIVDWGEGRALDVLDHDGDGDRDLLIVRSGDRPRLYRNEVGSERPWVRLDLRAPSPNTRAIGARVTVETARGERFVREVHAGGAYAGQHERVVHVGLGAEAACPVTVHVRWPDGATETREDLSCARVHRIERSD